MNEDDAEKGLVFWDVFIQAPLDALATKPRTEDDDLPGRAKQKRLDTTINMAGRMPRRYHTHSAREESMLAYVRDFKRTFEELYPYRCARRAAGAAACDGGASRLQPCPSHTPPGPGPLLSLTHAPPPSL